MLIYVENETLIILPDRFFSRKQEQPFVKEYYSLSFENKKE